MSSRLSLPLTVPESTAITAHSVFQYDSPYMRLRDALTPVFYDDRFAALFSNYKQPAEAPGRLALITMLQFTENLSDRRAAEAVRGRIDWKYLLGLELTDRGFNSPVLREFRFRLVEGDVNAQLLEMLLIIWREQQLLIPSEQPSNDLASVLTAVCAVDRLSYMIEVTQAARHALANSTLEELCAQASPLWAEHHVRPVDDHQIPRGAAARDDYATQIGRDAFDILVELDKLGNPIYPTRIPSLDSLNFFWGKNFRQVPNRFRVESQSSPPKKPRDWVGWLEINEDFPESFRRGRDPHPETFIGKGSTERYSRSYVWPPADLF